MKPIFSMRVGERQALEVLAGCFLLVALRRGTRGDGVSALPPNLFAMLSEVASLVLDDWALDRGLVFDDATKASVVGLFRDSRADIVAACPELAAHYSAMDRDTMRLRMRTVLEPLIVRELDAAHDAGRAP